jgi:IS605 OrfB family transposase
MANVHTKTGSAVRKTFTYQARITLSPGQDQALSDMAALLSQAERSLFADYNKGLNILKQKSHYQIKYGITARQFNSLRVMVQGKIKSQEALRNDYIKDTEHVIKKLKRAIKNLSRLKDMSDRQKNSLHQKKRRLSKLQYKLDRLKQDKADKRVRICFGSKKLFRQQYDLEAHGFASHEQWQEAWQQARDSQFFLVGSKDETMGNQSCIAMVNDSKLIDLKIRVPDALNENHGKYLTLEDIAFQYGEAEILAALSENITRNSLSKKASRDIHGDKYLNHGQAINYRFVKDAKGWLVFVTVDKVMPHYQSHRANGAIGVDINHDHLAISESDRSGNLVKAYNLPLCTYGKSKEQSKALIGDVIKQVVEHATTVQKPIVLEELDFRHKKRDLAQRAAKKARMLSSFSYAKIINMLISRAFRHGIETIPVNPAYSSVIGRVKFASKYTISVHQAAALVIARRLFGYSERLPRLWKNIPDNRGGRVTLPGLVKIQGRHVWHSWAKVVKMLKTALAAQHQMLRPPGNPSVVLTGDEDNDIPF